MPAVKHRSGFSGHSTYEMKRNESPNAFFSFWQCGHHSAPYITAPFSVRHWANVSREEVSGLERLRKPTRNAPPITRAKMAIYVFIFLTTLFHFFLKPSNLIFLIF